MYVIGLLYILIFSSVALFVWAPGMVMRAVHGMPAQHFYDVTQFAHTCTREQQHNVVQVYRGVMWAYIAMLLVCVCGIVAVGVTSTTDVFSEYMLYICAFGVAWHGYLAHMSYRVSEEYRLHIKRSV